MRVEFESPSILREKLATRMDHVQSGLRQRLTGKDGGLYPFAMRVVESLVKRAEVAFDQGDYLEALVSLDQARRLWLLLEPRAPMEMRRPPLLAP